MASRDAYARNVFINCPYTPEYRNRLQVLVFTLVRIGLEPKTAEGYRDSNQAWLNHILELIPQCNFSIHDLSKSKAQHQGEVHKMNMPFELGLDKGWDHFARPAARKASRSKQIMVLGEVDALKVGLSDMGGCQFFSYGEDERELAHVVRDFFYDKQVPFPGKEYPEAIDVWDDFNEFSGWIQIRDDGRIRSQRDLDRMIVSEYIEKCQEWVSESITK